MTPHTLVRGSLIAALVASFGLPLACKRADEHAARPPGRLGNPGPAAGVARSPASTPRAESEATPPELGLGPPAPGTEEEGRAPQASLPAAPARGAEDAVIATAALRPRGAATIHGKVSLIGAPTSPQRLRVEIEGAGVGDYRVALQPPAGCSSDSGAPEVERSSEPEPRGAGEDEAGTVGRIRIGQDGRGELDAPLPEEAASGDRFGRTMAVTVLEDAGSNPALGDESGRVGCAVISLEPAPNG